MIGVPVRINCLVDGAESLIASFTDFAVLFFNLVDSSAIRSTLNRSTSYINSGKTEVNNSS